MHAIKQTVRTAVGLVIPSSRQYKSSSPNCPDNVTDWWPTCKARINERYAGVHLELHARTANHIIQNDGQAFDLHAKYCSLDTRSGVLHAA